MTKSANFCTFYEKKIIQTGHKSLFEHFFGLARQIFHLDFSHVTSQYVTSSATFKHTHLKDGDKEKEYWVMGWGWGGGFLVMSPLH